MLIFIYTVNEISAYRKITVLSCSMFLLGDALLLGFQCSRKAELCAAKEVVPSLSNTFCSEDEMGTYCNRCHLYRLRHCDKQ